MSHKRYISFLLLTPLLFCSCAPMNKDFYDDEGRVILHTKVQRAFFKDTLDNVDLYARGVEELSRPLKPKFSWTGSDDKYTVYLSESNTYSDPSIYEVDTTSVEFTNLKIDTTYFFKVMNSVDVVSEQSFTTSKEIIRNIYISGVTNARDLGGYVTGDGEIIQGLLYRTAKLNKDSKEEVTNLITEKGINTMVNSLKVKSEIDLREVENNEVGGLTEGVGVLGEGVKYFQCPMDYDDLMSEDNIVSIRKIFSILSDEKNYPTFFHCSIGTDRTGYIAYLINAYLGVSEENLYRDYLFSNFGNIGGKRKISNISNKYVSKINDMSGNSLSDKTYNYLISLGVEPNHLLSLKDIMIQK